MNFIDILKVASENQGVAGREINKRGYSTSLGKAKREKRDKPKGVNSKAVQAFLKKKDDEEREKVAEAKKKKEELMKLRAEQNTLGKMNNIIKRNHTKEAIFQVEGGGTVGGADESTPATSGGGENDEDDVSFTRLRTETGSVKRRAVLSNVKRVQVNPHYVPKEERENAAAAEEKEKSKSSDKHSSSHDSKHSSSSSSKSSHSSDKHRSKHDGKSRDRHKHDKHDRYEEDRKKTEVKSKPEVKKKRPPAPPPMSFNDLLKIAEAKKNQEPALNKPKEAEKDKPKKDPVFDRPMTQEEKDRIMRKKSKEYRFWLQTGQRHPDSDIAKPKNSGAKSIKIRPNTQRSPSPMEADKPERSSSSPGLYSKSTASSSSNSNYKIPSSSSKTSNGSHSGSSKTGSSGSTSKTSNSSLSGSSKSGSVASKHSLSGSTSNGKSGLNSSSSAKSGKTDSNKNSRPFDASSKKLKLPSNGQRVEDRKPTTSKSSGRPQSSSSHKGSRSQDSSTGRSSATQSYAEENENVLVCGDKPPPQPKQPEQSTWDRIYGSMHKSDKHRKLKELAARKRRVIESDEESEYEDLDGFLDDDDDEDLDGFIDDSESNNVSKEIAAIFGYDRRRYRDVDDDDCRDMEANFAQIEREEKISARIGLKEDLEDMRQEEEELKRKALLKKQRAKKMKMR